VRAGEAAHAAGATAASLRLLSLAAGQQRRHSGYRGSAWAALGPPGQEPCPEWLLNGMHGYSSLALLAVGRE
jgi:hypothetical protein